MQPGKPVVLAVPTILRETVRDRVQLDDVQPVAFRDEVDGVVVAEGLRRSGNEFVEFDLGVHQFLEAVEQVESGRRPVRPRKEKRRDMDRERLRNLVIRQPQRAVGGRCELPFQQRGHGFPGCLDTMSVRFRPVGDQVLEGVQARVGEECDRRQVGEWFAECRHKLLPLAVRLEEDLEGTAELAELERGGPGQTGDLRAPRRAGLQHEPRKPDGAPRLFRSDGGDVREQTRRSNAFLRQVLGEGEQQGILPPHPGGEFAEDAPGEERPIALRLAEALAADPSRLSVQVQFGNAHDRLRRRAAGSFRRREGAGVVFRNRHVR